MSPGGSQDVAMGLPEEEKRREEKERMKGGGGATKGTERREREKEGLKKFSWHKQ